MNLSKKLITLAATVALSAGAVFSAPADGAKARRSEAREARMLHRHAGHLAKALNLTDAQKEQAKAIRNKHREANQGVRAELKELNTQIRAAREAKNTAEAQRLAALREPLLAKAQEAWQAQRSELMSVLTPEQQSKLEELRKAHTGKRQQRGA
ncbi:MAG TPA: Spy/CpxP family protein refolding chaperone [Bryobacteraceae bacterium]|nr:Spy/CpxP family protein refolding chaperone [Bryobacteraceae bacterium]